MCNSQFRTDALAVLDPSDGTNLYRYCGNDPINRADPSGLEEFQIGADGLTLTRRYSITPGFPTRNWLERSQRPAAGEWAVSGTGYTDTRSGRQTGTQIWYPLDEAAVDVINEMKFQKWVEQTEAALKDALANRHVPVSELGAGLGSNVWMADGGWLGRTYVHDVAVGDENFKLVYGPAPRSGGAGEPRMRVVAVKWSPAGEDTAAEAAELWFDYKGSAIKGAAAQTVVEASLLAIGQIAVLRAAAAPKAIRVFRVEGAPNTRILIGEGGSVTILEEQKALFLNFGNRARAEQYLAQKIAGSAKAGPLPGATVKSFEVPKKFLDDLRAAAVSKDVVRQFPSRPFIVDPTKAPDQYGLRPGQIEALKKFIIQGSGREGF